LSLQFIKTKASQVTDNIVLSSSFVIPFPFSSTNRKLHLLKEAFQALLRKMSIAALRISFLMAGSGLNQQEWGKHVTHIHFLSNRCCGGSTDLDPTTYMTEMESGC
jgi:hypothetical protein